MVDATLLADEERRLYGFRGWRLYEYARGARNPRRRPASTATGVSSMPFALRAAEVA